MNYIPYPKFLSKEWFKMYFNLGKEELKMLQRNKDNPAQSPKAKELMRERIDQLNRRQ